VIEETIMPRLAEETIEHDEDQLTQAEQEAAVFGADDSFDLVPLPTLTVVVPTPPKKRRTRKALPTPAPKPVAVSIAAYADHLFTRHQYLRQLRIKVALLREKQAREETVVATTSHPDKVTGRVPAPRLRFRRAPGHAYPMDAATFARWQAKYGKRAHDKMVEEAQTAIDTGHTRYFPDGGSDFMTRRTVPAIEKAVRDLLKKEGIELSSYYDPEKRQWFRLWEPTDLPPIPLRNVSRERALADGYVSESDRALAEGTYVRNTTFQMFRTIEGDDWDDLGPDEQHRIMKAKYDAHRAILQTTFWSDDNELARLKYIDGYLNTYEWKIHSLVAADRAARFEMKNLVRDNDDTEIPLQLIEQKQARINGLRNQLRDCQANFDVCMKLRDELVSATSIQWGAYRSIEQKATDKAARERRNKAVSHHLAGLSRPEYELWLKDQDWRVHRDGVAASDDE
jgi:hypothetical protein